MARKRRKVDHADDARRAANQLGELDKNLTDNPRSAAGSALQRNRRGAAFVPDPIGGKKPRGSQRGIKLIAGHRERKESNKAVMCCNDYMRLGRGRSIRKLADAYKAINAKGGNIPGVGYGYLCTLSAKYGWRERAEQYDAMMEARRTARADEILNSGLAQTHERVHMLNSVAKQVHKELARRGLYGRRKKGIGMGDNYEVVVEEVFRKDEIGALSKLLDDIAQETGGRQKRASLEVTGLAGLLSGAAGFDDAGFSGEEEEADADVYDADADADADAD